MQAQMGVNYFGPFYLTHLLLEVIARSTPRRMVFTGSATEGHGDLDEPDLTCAPHPLTYWNSTSRADNPMHPRVANPAPLTPASPAMEPVLNPCLDFFSPSPTRSTVPFCEIPLVLVTTQSL